jgi:hypothetical protein
MLIDRVEYTKLHRIEEDCGFTVRAEQKAEYQTNPFDPLDLSKLVSMYSNKIYVFREYITHQGEAL